MYSRNDPINFTDPSGLCSPEDGWTNCANVTITVTAPFPGGPITGGIIPQGTCLDIIVDGIFLGNTCPGQRGGHSDQTPDTAGGGQGQRGRGPSRPSIERAQRRCGEDFDALVFAAGFFDSLSFGVAPGIRRVIFEDMLGERDPVSAMGTNYDVGHMTGTGASLIVGSGRLVYAGGSKTVQLIARSAEDASAGRRILKTAGRLGLFANTRNPTFAELLAQGKTAEQIWASAGRTNLRMNAYGAALATTGHIGLYQQNSLGC